MIHSDETPSILLGSQLASTHLYTEAERQSGAKRVLSQRFKDFGQSCYDIFDKEPFHKDAIGLRVLRRKY